MDICVLGLDMIGPFKKA
jgi:transposase InsO family protein